ncbi:hypothetical protein ACRE1U_06325 [Helicobacter himalayensis]
MKKSLLKNKKRALGLCSGGEEWNMNFFQQNIPPPHNPKVSLLRILFKRI